MQTSWHKGASIGIELTDANLNLLLEKPINTEVEDVFKPTVTEPNVKWSPKGLVACKDFCKNKKKWRRKQMKVELTSDNALLQSRVNDTAAICQQFYKKHHMRGKTANGDESMDDDEVH